jgi:hypothetical protein
MQCMRNSRTRPLEIRTLAWIQVPIQELKIQIFIENAFLVLLACLA